MQIDSDHRVTSTLRAIALPSHAFSPAARASAAAEIATSRAKTTQAAQDLCNRIDRLLEEATAWNSEGISSQEAELLAYAAQAISKRQQRAERSAKKAEMRRESALKRSQDDSGSDQEIVESDSDEDTNGVFGSKSTINRQTQLRQSLQSVAQWLDDKTKQMWNDDEVFADMEQSAAQSGAFSLFFNLFMFAIMFVHAHQIKLWAPSLVQRSPRLRILCCTRRCE
jgi:hypothetical protein